MAAASRTPSSPGILFLFALENLTQLVEVVVAQFHGLDEMHEGGRRASSDDALDKRARLGLDVSLARMDGRVQVAIAFLLVTECALSHQPREQRLDRLRMPLHEATDFVDDVARG